MSDAVQFDNVSIVFGKDPAAALPAMDAGQSRAEIQQETGQVLGVHDCTLTVASGEILVLMGLSGSGKSTLLRAVNGLNPVVRGSVRIDGGDDGMVDITNADPLTLRKMRLTRVAMVFQQFGLLPWRNVVDNVALGLELAGIERSKREEQARAQLDLVGLTDWADRKVAELSGGMQQRVGLARAFATNAPILLMDEPSTGLAPIIVEEIFEIIGRLRDEGRTIFLVEQNAVRALQLADRAIILDTGTIVFDGSAKEVLDNKELREEYLAI